jgi:hypothetical protein
MVEKLDPKRFKLLLERAQREAAERIAVYQQLAGITLPTPEQATGASKGA